MTPLNKCLICQSSDVRNDEVGEVEYIQYALIVGPYKIDAHPTCIIEALAWIGWQMRGRPPEISLAEGTTQADLDRMVAKLQSGEPLTLPATFHVPSEPVKDAPDEAAISGRSGVLAEERKAAEPIKCGLAFQTNETRSRDRGEVLRCARPVRHEGECANAMSVGGS